MTLYFDDIYFFRQYHCGSCFVNYLCPWVSYVYYHVTIVTNMIHSVVVDKRFTITVGYFLTCTVCKQRALHSDSNSATTKSLSTPIIPRARGKKSMDLIKKSNMEKLNRDHHVPCFDLKSNCSSYYYVK